MAVIEFIGLIVGVGGIGFGIYQYQRAKRVDKRKDRLRELSESLDNIRDRSERFQTRYTDPLSDVDLDHQIDLLAKSVLAFKYISDQTPQIRMKSESEERGIQNKRQALDKFKEQNTWVDITLFLDDSGTDYHDDLSYSLDEHFLLVPNLYLLINEIRQESIDIIEEFDPGLLDELESIIDEIVVEAHGKAISHEDGFEFEPDKYDTLEDMKIGIFEEFFGI